MGLHKYPNSKNGQEARCADCGRIITTTDSRYWDGDTKKLYCIPCGDKMGGATPQAPRSSGVPPIKLGQCEICGADAEHEVYWKGRDHLLCRFDYRLWKAIKKFKILDFWPFVKGGEVVEEKGK